MWKATSFIEYMANVGEVTRLLQAGSAGDNQAMETLLPLVYDELRRVAGTLFRRERSNHTLQPTALVHEAYLRLLGQSDVTWQNRAHFFGIAATMMRRILVNHANSRNAEKRGGLETILSLDDAVGLFKTQNIEILALDQALEQLERLDARAAKIVEFRFFGGLTVEETAELLQISPTTVKRDWEMAKIWLYRTLNTASEVA